MNYAQIRVLEMAEGLPEESREHLRYMDIINVANQLMATKEPPTDEQLRSALNVQAMRNQATNAILKYSDQRTANEP